MTRVEQIRTQIDDAGIGSTATVTNARYTALDVHLPDGRVIRVFEDDGQVNVIEFNSARTMIEMGRATFNGYDAYTVARHIQVAAQVGYATTR